MIETLRGKHKSKKKEKVVKTHMTIEEVDKKILELKKEMKELAKSLQFEEAAKVRDEIKSLTEARLYLYVIY